MDRRSVVAFSVLIFLVCSSQLVKAQDLQKPNVVVGQDPTTKAQLPYTSKVEIGAYENDDAGVDALKGDFYESDDEFGPRVFVPGH